MAAPRNEDLKNTIIDAAQQLLTEQPISEVSLALIAQRAGISKGTLYYYFKTKNDILFAITDKYLDEQWNELIKWTSDPTKDTSLSRLIKYVAERATAFPEIRTRLLYDAVNGNEEIRQKLIKRYSQFEELISEKISERTDSVAPGYLAWLILLASDGLLIQKRLRNDLLDTETIIAESEKYARKIRNTTD